MPTILHQYFINYLNNIFNKMQNRQICAVYLFVLISIIITGCTTLKPEFDKDIFPEDYKVPEKLKYEHLDQINVFPTSVKQDIFSLWANKKFTRIYQQNHPILNYTHSDLVDLYYHLSNSFRVFYINRLSKDSRIELDILIDKIKCDPLSNLEVKYIMNNGSISAVSEKRLTMLIISLHEALIRVGYQAIYPRIRSNYLRKIYHLPFLRMPVDFNVINNRKNIDSGKLFSYHFLFCRK